MIEAIMPTVLAVLAIIALDIVLSGDNAIVIALASRNLPEEQKKKAMIYGTLGAVVMRIIFTVLALWLMTIPFLQTIGAVLLMYIAVKLLLDNTDHTNIKEQPSLGKAIQTILIADVTLSLDNVFAVAGAANGSGSEHSFALVIFGLILSVPIMVWGSSLIQKAINKYPIIIYIGSALLGLASGKMILEEKYMSNIIGQFEALHWILPLFVALTVVIIGKVKSMKANKVAIEIAK